MSRKKKGSRKGKRLWDEGGMALGAKVKAKRKKGSGERKKIVILILYHPEKGWKIREELHTSQTENGQNTLPCHFPSKSIRLSKKGKLRTKKGGGGGGLLRRRRSVKKTARVTRIRPFCVWGR